MNARKTHRRLLLRLMAVMAGLSFFVVIEGLLWLAGLGQPDAQDDPFVGFNDLQPLFEADAETNSFRIPESRRRFFAPDSFPTEKRTGTTRIFCLGGSTVQGRPFSKETSFTTWLRLALETAQPTANWEVINCGGISYASYRLVPILKECLQYEPDLFIICTGHNEFLEDRTYADIRDTSAVISVPHQWLARTRSYHVYRDLLLSAAGDGATRDRSMLKSEVETFLDYHDGLKAFHRDRVWSTGVQQHFLLNLNRMLQMADGAQIPVVLVLPPSNLGDTSPFKSEHRSGLSERDLRTWNGLIARAREQMRSSLIEALATLDGAIAIDDEYAATHFWRGRLLEVLNQFEEARVAFVLARDEDICPLRILSGMEQSLRDSAERWDVPILDAHRLLEAESRHGILDNSLLVDHVHPNFEGHQLIALALAEIMRTQGWVHLDDDWQQQSAESFEEHLDELPRIYFLRGEQNLEGLRFWSQGLADGPPVESRFPERITPDSPRP